MRAIYRIFVSILLVCAFGISTAIADGGKYSAYVVYGENLQSPMPKIVAKLYDSNGQYIDMAETDKKGVFEFKNLNEGVTYTLHFGTYLEPFGIDFKDAFLLLKYLNNKASLTPFQLQAADVNGDSKVNHADLAFIVSNWFLNKENFPAGGWVFPVWTFTCNTLKAAGPDGPITVVSRGDITSDLPPVIKEAQTVINKVKEFNYTENQFELNLPLSFTKNQKVYAVGLEMAFNSKDIEIIGLSTKFENTDYIFNDNGVKMSWISESGKAFRAGQEILSLNVRIRSNENIEAVLGLLSEAQFVGENGEVLQNVQLNMPKLKKSDLQLEIGNPYPNPGNNEVSFDLNQIYTQTVVVEVYNLAGQYVKQINASPKNSKITISTSDLPNGTYLCSIKIDSNREVRLFNVQH